MATAGVLAGNQLARWFGAAVLGLSAIDQMFFIPAYPAWFLMMIAVDVVELYDGWQGSPGRKVVVAAQQ